MKEMPIFVKILSGQACGISYIAMETPNMSKLNKTIIKVLQQDLISVEVEKVECLEGEESNIVNIICSVDNSPNVALTLNYVTSPEDYQAINNFYKKYKSPKLAKDSRNAIMLVKNIIDSYDPFIQLAYKEE